MTHSLSNEQLLSRIENELSMHLVMSPPCPKMTRSLWLQHNGDKYKRGSHCSCNMLSGSHASFIVLKEWINLA